MRQGTLASELADLYALDLTTRCRVEALAAGDDDAPDWAMVLRRIDVQLQALSADQAVADAQSYEQRVTHQAYAVNNVGLKIGYRLVETYRQDEHGLWEMVRSPRTWIILGKELVPGVPGQFSQVRLTLNQTSAVT